MPFCNKCGTQHQDGAQFCPNCGNTLAPKSGNATQSEHIGTTGNNNTPALWNPKAAVWWSLLFFPLGPILHFLNWEALGKKKEAKEAKKFFIIFCVFCVILAFIPADYARYLSCGMFCAWGMWGWGWFMKRGIKIAEEKGKPTLGMTGKGQMEYVAEKYGTEYKRKSWLAPLAISFGILIVWCILGVAIESLYEEIGISSQYIEDDDARIEPAEAEAAARAVADSIAAVVRAEPAKTTANQPSNKVCKPSFDCKKASTTAEKLICFGETCEVLASLDKKMSEVYKNAKTYYKGYESEELLKAQKKFVKDRDDCSNAICVENMYKSRISFLEEEMN